MTVPMIELVWVIDAKIHVRVHAELELTVESKSITQFASATMD